MGRKEEDAWNSDIQVLKTGRPVEYYVHQTMTDGIQETFSDKIPSHPVCHNVVCLVSVEEGICQHIDCSAMFL